MAYEKKIDFNKAPTIRLGGEGNPTSIEGYYLGSKTTADKGYGPGVLHFFKTENGVTGVWGKTVLNNTLSSDERGMMCRVTFTGMGDKVKGKHPAFLYDVEYDKSNTISVSGINLNAPSEEQADDDIQADDAEETDLDEDERPMDETPVSRSVLPKRGSPSVGLDRATQSKAVDYLTNRRSKV